MMLRELLLSKHKPRLSETVYYRCYQVFVDPKRRLDSGDMALTREQIKTLYQGSYCFPANNSGRGAEISPHPCAAPILSDSGTLRTGAHHEHLHQGAGRAGRLTVKPRLSVGVTARAGRKAARRIVSDPSTSAPCWTWKPYPGGTIKTLRKWAIDRPTTPCPRALLSTRVTGCCKGGLEIEQRRTGRADGDDYTPGWRLLQ